LVSVPASERVHDVVLFGATGFTGGLTAEYLARHAPAETRWALAGRSREKLEGLRARLSEINPDCAELALLEADVEDPGSIGAVAEATRVVITTVGPYINYGEPLVAACAAAGTDYVDLTGEPEFVDLMWLRHHESAERSGARIVHSCGFDSIPHDLGAYYTVQQLPEGVPLEVEGYVGAGGSPSGGTYHSAIHGFARARHYVRVARERRRRERRPTDRKVRIALGRVRYDRSLGSWLVPFPAIDPQVVTRSARALERYGPDFSYGHYLQIKRLPVVAGLMGGVGAAFTLAQIPPTRKLLLSLRDPGTGPTLEQREKGWFKVRFRGEGGGQTVTTEVRGGDPGYGETAKMLAESALCLAHDELPERVGQLTPVVAMGDALRDRLERAGIEFGVVDRT
jgi:short subunit dehydrogenase-like uncharacterized protein